MWVVTNEFEVLVMEVEVLYIALAALAITMPLMFIYICKKRNEHDFQPIGSLRAI